MVWISNDDLGDVLMWRIIFISISLFVAVPVIIEAGIKLIKGDISVVFPLVILISYLIYALSILKGEFLKVKRDRKV